MYNPKLSLTNDISNFLIEIEKLKQKIDIAKILPQQVVRLKHRATVDSTYYSTTIEGNPLNRNQVEQVLSGKLTTQEYAVIEVANYKKALDWINKEYKKDESISTKIALYLHELVTNNLLPEKKVGRVRTGPIYIVDIEDKKEILRYEGPNPDKVSMLLDELFDWLSSEKKLHPIIKSAILHYEFVSIHPFSDGNGRVTRLLTKLFLDVVDYDFKGGLTLDSYYLENRLRYYEELNQALDYPAQRKADLTDWIHFFLKGFLVNVEKLANEVMILSSVDQNIKIDFTQEDITILDYIASFGSISSGEVVEMLNINERTAQRRIKRLIENKVLKRKGEARNIRYELVEFKKN
jgi:Fic family protein